MYNTYSFICLNNGLPTCSNVQQDTVYTHPPSPNSSHSHTYTCHWDTGTDTAFLRDNNDTADNPTDPDLPSPHNKIQPGSDRNRPGLVLSCIDPMGKGLECPSRPDNSGPRCRLSWRVWRCRCILRRDSSSRQRRGRSDCLDLLCGKDSFKLRVFMAIQGYN